MSLTSLQQAVEEKSRLLEKVFYKITFFKINMSFISTLDSCERLLAREVYRAITSLIYVFLLVTKTLQNYNNHFASIDKWFTKATSFEISSLHKNIYLFIKSCIFLLERIILPPTPFPYVLPLLKVDASFRLAGCV